MAKGIDLSIAADTRSAMSAIQRGIIDPLEDVTDLLEKTGREGKDAGDDLERAMRDAQRRTDDAKDEIRDLRDELNKAGRAGKKVGDDAGDGMHKLKAGAEEVTQEVGQNLGEAVSSIRGDLSDLSQVGQDTLGGLAATLAGSGPAGIAGAAALAAGAVGLGLVTAEVEKQNERVQQLKEYFAEAWQEAVAGGRDYIDQATIIGEMNDIIFNPDRADEYKKIQEDANKLSLDRGTLLRAAAGDQDALNEVMGRSKALYDDQEQALQKVVSAGADRQDSERLGILEEMNQLEGLTGRWKQYGDINAENQEKARQAAKLTSDYLLSAIDSADSATKAVDDFGNVLITLPDGQEIVIDAKTGQASADVSKFKTDTDNVVNQLDGSQINLIVKTALRDAQNDINRFVAANDGKSFKLHGRVTVDNGGWNG